MLQGNNWCRPQLRAWRNFWLTEQHCLSIVTIAPLGWFALRFGLCWKLVWRASLLCISGTWGEQFAAATSRECVRTPCWTLSNVPSWSRRALRCWTADFGTSRNISLTRCERHTVRSCIQFCYSHLFLQSFMPDSPDGLVQRRAISEPVGSPVQRSGMLSTKATWTFFGLTLYWFSVHLQANISNISISFTTFYAMKPLNPSGFVLIREYDSTYTGSSSGMHHGCCLIVYHCSGGSSALLIWHAKTGPWFEMGKRWWLDECALWHDRATDEVP